MTILSGEANYARLYNKRQKFVSSLYGSHQLVEREKKHGKKTEVYALTYMAMY